MESALCQVDVAPKLPVGFEDFLRDRATSLGAALQEQLCMRCERCGTTSARLVITGIELERDHMDTDAIGQVTMLAACDGCPSGMYLRVHGLLGSAGVMLRLVEARETAGGIDVPVRHAQLENSQSAEASRG